MLCVFRSSASLSASIAPSASAWLHNPALSLWLSVDPLSDKYPNLSPYVYCANNPVMIKDPDGDTLKFADGVSQELKNKYAQAYTFMKEHGTSGILDNLDESTSTIYIDECNGTGSYSPNKSTIYWDPNTAAYTDEGILLSPATILNHEADHALESILNPQQQRLNRETQDDQYDNAEERRVITGSEQKTAFKHGEIKEGQITRKNHRAYLYHVDSPTSTGTTVIIAPQD